MKLSNVQVNVTIGEIIGHAVLWFIVSIITLGIGALIYPYAFGNFIIDRIYFYDANGMPIAKLKSELEIPTQIGHALLWLIISIVTLGIGYFIYIYKVAEILFDNASMVEV